MSEIKKTKMFLFSMNVAMAGPRIFEKKLYLTKWRTFKNEKPFFDHIFDFKDKNKILKFFSGRS